MFNFARTTSKKKKKKTKKKKKRRLCVEAKTIELNGEQQKLVPPVFRGKQIDDLIHRLERVRGGQRARAPIDVNIFGGFGYPPEYFPIPILRSS